MDFSNRPIKSATPVGWSGFLKLEISGHFFKIAPGV